MEFVNIFIWVDAVRFDYDVSLGVGRGGRGGMSGGRGRKLPSTTKGVGYCSHCSRTTTSRSGDYIGAGGRGGGGRGSH